MGKIDSKKAVESLTKALNEQDEAVSCLRKHILEDREKKMGYSSQDELIKGLDF